MVQDTPTCLPLSSEAGTPEGSAPVAMLDPGALGMFQQEMTPSSSRQNGRSPDQESSHDLETRVTKVQINDQPETSESGEELVVTRTGRSRGQSRGQSRDTGVFKGAMPKDAYSGQPHTRTVMIEEDEESEERENGQDVREGQGQRVDPRGYEVRSPDSEASGSQEYEYTTERPQKSRRSKREIIPDSAQDDGFTFQGQRMRIGAKQKGGKLEGGKRFLKKVQHELEEQRNEWKSEMDRMTQGSEKLQKLPVSSQTGGSNSYVDTSSGNPVYKAFFDVSEFPPSSISVTIDKLTNKVVVQASQSSTRGNMSKSFTQKVQLPRFADEHRLTSRLSKNGILKVEVPLLYYFDEKGDKDKQAKSFVNEVKTNPRSGKQNLEILVNTDPNIRAKDLHVQVEDDKLIILADTVSKSGRPKQKLIKQYTLPELADLDKIKSRLGRDGRLAITVPLKRVRTDVRDSATPAGFQTLKHEVSRQYHNGTPLAGYRTSGYQTLGQPYRGVSRSVYSSQQTMPYELHKSEPILYQPQHPTRTMIPASSGVERVKIVKSSRKVRH